MPLSQNARFSGQDVPDFEFVHPPGASIARLLKAALAKRGWQVSDIEDWRNGGWSITCCRPESKLELVIVKETGDNAWFLQIGASYLPGFVGWLLSKPASAQPDAIQALAEDAFSILSEESRFGNFMWCWDGFPEHRNSTPKPVRAE